MATGGACAFSDELIASLEAMNEEERTAWLDILRAKRRYLDVYQVLVLVLGLTGLHALYLRNWLSFLTRVVLTAATLALCALGFLEVDFDLLEGAGGVVLMMALLWLADYVTATRTLRRYHHRVEKKAVSFLQAQATRRAARRAKARARGADSSASLPAAVSPAPAAAIDAEAAAPALPTLPSPPFATRPSVEPPPPPAFKRVAEPTPPMPVAAEAPPPSATPAMTLPLPTLPPPPRPRRVNPLTPSLPPAPTRRRREDGD